MSQITTYVDGAGGAITTVTGNVGGAVSPDAAGDIGFTGAGYLTVTGTPGSNSLEVSLDSNAAITAIQGWNGAIVESPVATVASDGTTITLSVERSGTGDLTVVFSDGFYDWDTTPAATVTLTAGSDTAPQLNYIYFDKATKTLLSSTVSWPSTEHAPIATVLCQSAASLQTDGSYKVHAWTDHVKASNDSGHIGHLNYWIRYQNATWRSGVTPTLTITTQGAAPDDVIFTSSSGSVLQLHDHAFPTFSGTPDMYVVNDSTTAYDKITNMNTILTDSTGATLSARYFSLVVWGVVSEAGADCKLMVNLPGGSYGNASTLDADLSKYADFSIPSDFKGTGFLIAQINLRHQTISSGTWTLLDTIDLRGLYPSLSAGGATAAATEFEDNVFRILDEGDNTKKIAFEVSGVTTGTVRTITMDDRDIDLDAVPDQFATDSGTATPAAGIATIAGGDTIVTSGAGSTVTVDTTGALKTDSGFEAWTGTGNYFDDTVIGTFQILRGGSGYIKGVPVSFTGPQSVTGLITGEVYWIYIDNTGTLQKTTTRTHSLYEENIVLFICARDSTSPTNVQITVKENHPFGYPVRVSNYNHDVVGTVISNINNGANITLNGTQKIQINGSDELANHGLYTTISDSSGVAESFYQVYTLATGKWAVYVSSDTFTGYYNNAGTPTVLGASKYGVYTLYAGKDSLNTVTPRYVAILDTSEYSNLAAAQTAVANGTTAAKSGGLLDLEITQLGYIVYQKSTDTIVDVIIAKATVQQVTTTGGTNVASLVTTSTTNFDGILSAGDTNVQASLETIDDWGKLVGIANGGTNSTTMANTYGVNYFDGSSIITTTVGTATHVLTSNGTGVAPTFQAISAGAVASVTGGTNINTSGTAADPVVNLDTSPSVSGSVTAGTGVTITTGDLDVSSGSINLPTTTSSDGIININSSPVFHTYGGSGNIFLAGAGNFTTTGAGENIGIGTSALNSLTTGYNNVAIGYNAGSGITGTHHNVIIGHNAQSVGMSNTIVAIGYEAAINNICEFGTFIGYKAWGRGTNGYYSVAIGHLAGYNYTGAERDNICITSPGVAGDANTMRLGTQGSGNAQIDTTFIAGIYNTAPSGGSDNVVVIDSNGQLGAQASLDVANGGTGATTLTDHGILLGNATGSVTATAELSNGQLAIGSTGNVPTLATLTAGTGIAVTNAAGSITVASTGTTLNNQTGTTYTLVLTDAGKHITLTNAAAITVTIPTNASVAFPIGTVISFSQGGAGQATFSGAVPPTLRSADSALTTVKIYSVCSCIKIATDEWIFGGDLEA